MCGRYVTPDEMAMERAWSDILPVFSLEQYSQSFNVAPSGKQFPGSLVPVVRRNSDGGLTCNLIRWELIPFWARGTPGKYRTYNARWESVRSAASYRGAWKRGRRCLFVMSGFYEWQVVAGSRVKQPWYITAPDQPLMAVGGIWDRSEAEDGAVIESCSIITLPANGFLEEIHNTRQRMPLIVLRGNYAAWLSGDAQAAAACVTQYPADALQAWPVSTYVNRVVNDDLKCIEGVR